MEFLERHRRKSALPSASAASHKVLAAQRKAVADLHAKTIENLFQLFPEEKMLKQNNGNDNPKQRKVPGKKWSKRKGRKDSRGLSFPWSSTDGPPVPSRADLELLIRTGARFDPLTFDFSSERSDRDDQQRLRDQGTTGSRGGRSSGLRRPQKTRGTPVPAPPGMEGALSASSPSTTFSPRDMRTLKRKKKTLAKIVVGDFHDNESNLDDKTVIAEATTSSSVVERRGGKAAAPKGPLALLKQESRALVRHHSVNDPLNPPAAHPPSLLEGGKRESSPKGGMADMPAVSRAKIRQKFLGEFLAMAKFDETQLPKLTSMLKAHGDIDGSIDLEGFIRALAYFFERRLVEVKTGSRERGFLQHMFEVFVDTGKEDLMDFREFAVTLAGQLECSLHTKVKVLFQVYDLDDDGCITIHELCDLMNKGHDATWELVDYTENFFELMDDNGDGNIDWEEFKNAVTREPLVLESFSRCLPPGIVYGEVDRRAIKMLFARLTLDWTGLKKLWKSLKDAAAEYFEKVCKILFSCFRSRGEGYGRSRRRHCSSSIEGGKRKKG